MVVDFEEPRSFEATIKWPAGWAMQHPANQLRETPSSAPFLKYGTQRRMNNRPSRKENIVPRLLRARAPEDAEEERKVSKLASSRHAPGDWIFRASIISRSWQGLRNAKIAEELGCHPKTVRERIHRFNDEGIDGFGDRPRAGRKPRLTELERSKIIALVGKNPPGKLLTEPDGALRAEDETKAAYWTLDALAQAAREIGIEIGRSQVRRILLREGVRWRNTRPWAQSSDPEFAPKGPGSSNSTPTLRRTPRWSASTSLVRSHRVPSLRLRDGRPMGIALKRPWSTAEVQTRCGSSALCGSRTASRSRSPRAQETPKAT
jgi:transposase